MLLDFGPNKFKFEASMVKRYSTYVWDAFLKKVAYISYPINLCVHNKSRIEIF